MRPILPTLGNCAFRLRCEGPCESSAALSPAGLSSGGASRNCPLGRHGSVPRQSERLMHQKRVAKSPRMLRNADFSPGSSALLLPSVSRGVLSKGNDPGKEAAKCQQMFSVSGGVPIATVTHGKVCGLVVSRNIAKPAKEFNEAHAVGPCYSEVLACSDSPRDASCIRRSSLIMLRSFKTKLREVFQHERGAFLHRRCRRVTLLPISSRQASGE